MDEWRQSLEVARVAMREAQERYAAYADLHRTDRAFKAKDRVYLSTANLSLKANPAKAFRPRWIGPFEITRVVSPVAYELKLPRPWAYTPCSTCPSLSRWKRTRYRSAPPHLNLSSTRKANRSGWCGKS
jgi:hypothetical protein